jgi:hypothetical protein
MNWKAAFGAGLMLLVTVTLYAQTPDGETPSSEGACDELIFSTPGLYGLCIAYCEAQDLDSTGTVEPENIINSKSKEKILENYNETMVEDFDPPMPCLTPPPECPCFTYQEVAAIADTEPSADNFHCFNGPTPGMELWQTIQSTVGIPWDPFDERDAIAYEFKWEEEHELGCEYRNYLWDGEDSTEVLQSWVVAQNVENRVLYQACVDIMDAVFATFTLNCN